MPSDALIQHIQRPWNSAMVQFLLFLGGGRALLFLYAQILLILDLSIGICSLVEHLLRLLFV